MCFQRAAPKIIDSREPKYNNLTQHTQDKEATCVFSGIDRPLHSGHRTINLTVKGCPHEYRMTIVCVAGDKIMAPLNQNQMKIKTGGVCESNKTQKPKWIIIFFFRNSYCLCRSQRM